jgi:hypothetical protein
MGLAWWLKPAGTDEAFQLRGPTCYPHSAFAFSTRGPPGPAVPRVEGPAGGPQLQPSWPATLRVLPPPTAADVRSAPRPLPVAQRHPVHSGSWPCDHQRGAGLELSWTGFWPILTHLTSVEGLGGTHFSGCSLWSPQPRVST